MKKVAYEIERLQPSAQWICNATLPLNMRILFLPTIYIVKNISLMKEGVICLQEIHTTKVLANNMLVSHFNPIPQMSMHLIEIFYKTRIVLYYSKTYATFHIEVVVFDLLLCNVPIRMENVYVALDFH